MLGIMCQMECQGCGALIKHIQPFWTKELREKYKDPKKCGYCGSASLTLLDFEKCSLSLDEEQPKEQPQQKDDIPEAELEPLPEAKQAELFEK